MAEGRRHAIRPDEDVQTLLVGLASSLAHSGIKRIRLRSECKATDETVCAIIHPFRAADIQVEQFCMPSAFRLDGHAITDVDAYCGRLGAVER